MYLRRYCPWNSSFLRPMRAPSHNVEHTSVFDHGLTRYFKHRFDTCVSNPKLVRVYVHGNVSGHTHKTAL